MRLPAAPLSCEAMLCVSLFPEAQAEQALFWGPGGGASASGELLFLGYCVCQVAIVTD